MRLRALVIGLACAFVVATPATAIEEDWYELISPLLPAAVGNALSLAPAVSPTPAEISADIPARDDPNRLAIDEAKFANQDRGGFNTAQLFARTLEAFPDCIDYCIDGFVFGFTLFGGARTVLRIHHRNADLLVQTYPSLVENEIIPANPLLGEFQSQYTAPWREWGGLFGGVIHGITLNFADEWLPPSFSDFGQDGGQVSVREYGETQTHNFKEVDVIGHPYVLVPILLDTNGEIPPFETCTGRDDDICTSRLPEVIQDAIAQEAADLEPEEGPEGQPLDEPEIASQTPEELIEAGIDNAVTEITDFGDRVVTCAQSLECILLELVDAAEFRQLFSVLDTIEQLTDTIATINEFATFLSDVFTVIGGAGFTFAPRLDRLLCQSSDGDGPMTPFTPYYLSGIDPVWRNGLIDFDPLRFGFPNDVHRWQTVLNPLSNDRVGENNEIWGHIYPRSGVYNHPHDAKGGSVIVKRGVDIVEEDWDAPGTPRRRLRWNANGLPQASDDSGERFPARYQMVYPFSENSCGSEPWDLDRAHNAHGDFMFPGVEQRYAFNYWRKTSCLTGSPGIELGSVDIPDICL